MYIRNIIPRDMSIPLLGYRALSGWDEASRNSQMDSHLADAPQPHACLNGHVYLGFNYVGEDGEEYETFEALPCRRCALTETRERKICTMTRIPSSGVRRSATLTRRR
jgi:hypothetical protein